MARFGDDRDKRKGERPAQPTSRQTTSKSQSETPSSASSDPAPHTARHEANDEPRAPESVRSAGPQPRERHEDTRPTEGSERLVYELRGRKFRLSSEEADTLRAAGAFRTVRADDVVQGVYQGDGSACERELKHLEAQGLITVSKFRGRPGERFINLTPDAKRLADQHLKRTAAQRSYAGMAKVQELDHDAALYKMYLKAVEGIHERGGTPTRVVLDYELKTRLNRELEHAKKLPPDEQGDALDRLAREHDLTVVDGKIPLPDVRVEYETRDGERAHLDLEYVTGNYRAEAIAEKARAGFSLYAPAGFDRSSGGSAGRRVRDEFPSLAAEIVSL